MAVDPEKETPEKPEEETGDIRKKPMHTEDKVFLGILLVGVIGLLFVARWIISGLFGLSVGMSEGIGFKSALIYATGLSTALIIIFALVSGDGVVGELPTVIIGFFLLIVFFTFSIALIL